MDVYIYNPTIFWAFNHRGSYKNINAKDLKNISRRFIINAC